MKYDLELTVGHLSAYLIQTDLIQPSKIIAFHHKNKSKIFLDLTRPMYILYWFFRYKNELGLHKKKLILETFLIQYMWLIRSAKNFHC